MNHRLVLLACAIPLATAGCEKLRTIIAEKLGGLESQEQNSSGTGGGKSLITMLTESSYEEFIARKDALVVINHGADWCGACRQLDPVLSKVSAEFDGMIQIGKVDVDRDKNLALRNRVRALPDVRIFRDGKPVHRFNGAMPEGELRELFSRLTTETEPETKGIFSLVDRLRSKTGEAAGETGDPQDPQKSGEPAEPAIRPMEKDWMPPGIERR